MHFQENYICMMDIGVYEPLRVKAHAIKSAVETAIAILRIDEVITAKRMNEEEKPELVEQLKRERKKILKGRE